MDNHGKNALHMQRCHSDSLSMLNDLTLSYSGKMHTATRSRSYIRHPSGIPFFYRVLNRRTSSDIPSQLNDVSIGGICFKVDDALTVGDRLHLCIPVHTPAFEAEGTVEWCEKINSQFYVGVSFNNIDTKFAVKMIEQVCFIEQYRRDLRHQGREVTSDVAAKEWIAQHAQKLNDF